MTKLKSLDDYTKLPDGYTDYDFRQKIEESCTKALESLAKEKIKSRLATMPKIYVVSSYPLDKESLLELVKMQPILTKHEDCTIIYLGTYYKPLKRRLTHGYRSSKKKPRLH